MIIVTFLRWVDLEHERIGSADLGIVYDDDDDGFGFKEQETEAEFLLVLFLKGMYKCSCHAK